MAITLLVKIIVGSSCATATTLGIVYREKVAEFFGITWKEDLNNEGGVNEGAG